MLTAVCVHGARRRRPVYVTNAERTLLRLAGGRLGGVVCLVALAARAAARRNPEVGRTSVEVNAEALCGRADGNRARPLQVVALVSELDASTLLEARGVDVGVELLELLGAEIGLEVD